MIITLKSIICMVVDINRIMVIFCILFYTIIHSTKQSMTGNKTSYNFQAQS